MSFVTGNRTTVPGKFWTSQKAADHWRQLATAIRDILDGRVNSTFVVTLEAGQTKTEVRHLPARPGHNIQVTPRNAAAAALSRTTDVFGEADTEKVRICHSATADGTEKFNLVVFG